MICQNVVWIHKTRILVLMKRVLVIETTLQNRVLLETLMDLMLVNIRRISCIVASCKRPILLTKQAIN